jgi:hypothetical protein
MHRDHYNIHAASSVNNVVKLWKKNCTMDENMSKLLSETNKEFIPMLMKSMWANGVFLKARVW